MSMTMIKTVFKVKQAGGMERKKKEDEEKAVPFNVGDSVS